MSLKNPDKSSDDPLSVAEARETVERLKAILNGAAFAIITIDETGCVETFNPAAEKIFGYSADEAIGQDVKLLMPESYARDHGQYIENYLTTGKKKVIGLGRRVTGKRKSGEEFPIHLTISESQAINRRLFTGMIQDISAQVEAEHTVDVCRDELHHVGRISAMGELASALAHEVNQPLTAIINFAGAAQRVLENEQEDAIEKATKFIVNAADEALRAGEIIRRLRSFVEMTETERRAQDIVVPIKEAVQLSLFGEQSKAIEITWDVDERLPQVLIDRIQIQQVFQNIIRNASDVLADQPGEKRIKLEIKRLDGNTLKASVEDNGPGLDASVKERLFMPFVTSKKNGMGIGLSISRNIIEAHGGKIYAEQAAPKGTRFCVILPVVQGDDNPDA